MKKLLSALLGLCAAFAPAANAQLEYKQVGTLKTGDYSYRTSNYPVYTMSKYGQGITLYSKAFLGLNDNTLIKELTYLGYQSSTKTGDLKFTMWVANTTETTVQPFIVEGEQENGKATTHVDLSRFTKFGEISMTEMPAAGSMSEAVEILTFTSAEGFTYTGENLVIFIDMNEGVSSSTAVSPFTTFFTANNGAAGNCVGGYRESGNNSETNPGYGINTKSWSYETSSRVKLPVIKLGYEGDRVAVSATVKGRVVSSLNSAGINGATVTFGGQTQVTPTSGLFEFTIDDVDMAATYTLSASAPGFDPASRVIDIKSGGVITVDDVVLTKQPVPAVLSGKVIDNNGFIPIPGASVTFNSTTVTSAADGSYSFSIANIDELPADGCALSANADGYLPYTTTLQLRGDLDFNIQMDALPELPGEGVLVGEWGVDSYDYRAPFNPLWKNSESQVIYPATALTGIQSGDKFSSVTFYGYYPEPSSGEVDPGTGEDEDYDYYTAPARTPESRTYNLKVYLLDEEETAFPATGFTPVSTMGLTPNFEGPVTISTGGSETAPVAMFKVDLANAYTYGGNSIRVIVEATDGTSALFYFCQDKTLTSNVIARSGTNEISQQTFVYVTSGAPVMRLGDYVSTGTISGTVTESGGNTPIEGVTVTVTGNGVSLNTTTDAQGQYSVQIRDVTLDSRYRVNFSKDPYYDETEDVTFTAENLDVTLNVEMFNPDSGVSTIGADSAVGYDVYTVTGLRILRGADAQQLRDLPAGIYIVNGKRCVSNK